VLVNARLYGCGKVKTPAKHLLNQVAGFTQILTGLLLFR
jgi:hypothetical protein